MEAAADELRAGSRVPVTIDHMVNDTLVVTLTFLGRSYTGILLDCGKKYVLCPFILSFLFVNCCHF